MVPGSEKRGWRVVVGAEVCFVDFSGEAVCGAGELRMVRSEDDVRVETGCEVAMVWRWRECWVRKKERMGPSDNLSE